MYTRLIRHEILESDRWLDLPSDTHRLAFFCLLLVCDDFGNFKGGPRRVFRFLHRFTQIKSDADAIKLLSELQDADLVRRYEADENEFWHIPRFRNARRYTCRLWPKSPWCGDDTLSSIEKKQVHKQKSAANLPQICGQSAADLPLGVGVGVGEGVGVGVSIVSANADTRLHGREDPPEFVQDISESETRVPFQKIVELYHQHLPAWPRCEELNVRRKGYIRQRWLDQLPDLQTWADYFDFCGESQFLSGQSTPAAGRKVFRANLEWITNPSHFTDIIERKYHR